jgi:SAM-dependent methyltransferase
MWRASLMDVAERHHRRWGPNSDGFIGGKPDAAWIGYEIHLGPIRKSVKRVLEIGVFEGAGLRTWREYFPNAEILGIDNQEKHKLTEERIRTFIGRQGDPAFLSTLPGEFDVIIDDGSHHEIDIVTSFNSLWPRLNTGGHYIVEDMHAWRKEQWTGNIIRNWLPQRIEWISAGRQSEIESLHCYRELLIMKKGKGVIV